MNAAEQLIYILRLAVISTSAVILVIILGLTQLEVGPAQHYHVDTHISQVLYGAEFWDETGIIDKNKFTQQSLPQYGSRDKDSELFIDFTLTTDGQNTTITLHEQAAQRLRAVQNLRGINKETYMFPVMLTSGQPANLTAEVYYELR